MKKKIMLIYIDRKMEKKMYTIIANLSSLINIYLCKIEYTNNKHTLFFMYFLFHRYDIASRKSNISKHSTSLTFSLKHKYNINFILFFSMFIN